MEKIHLLLTYFDPMQNIMQRVIGRGVFTGEVLAHVKLRAYIIPENNYHIVVYKQEDETSDLYVRPMLSFYTTDPRLAPDASADCAWSTFHNLENSPETERTIYVETLLDFALKFENPAIAHTVQYAKIPTVTH